MPKYQTFCCGDIIESNYRHDFKRCSCGRSYVDGGDSYSRVGFTDPDKPPEPITDPVEAQTERLEAAYKALAAKHDAAVRWAANRGQRVGTCPTIGKEVRELEAAARREVVRIAREALDA